MTAETDLSYAAKIIKPISEALGRWWRGDSTHDEYNGVVDIPSPAKLVADLTAEVAAIGPDVLAAAATATAQADRSESEADRSEAGAQLAETYADIQHSKATWAALASVTGVTGDNGLVPDEDTGTHTDPVVGGTVPNAGRYTWAADGLGSAQAERVGTTWLAGKANQADLNAEELTRADADAALSGKIGNAESRIGVSFDVPVSAVLGSVEPDALTANTLFVYGPADALVASMPLQEVRARFAAAGIAKIEIISAAGVILQQWQVSAAAGINTFAAGADFDAGYVPPAGAHLGIRWVSGSFLRYSNVGDGSYAWNRVGSSSVGDTVVDPRAVATVIAVEVTQAFQTFAAALAESKADAAAVAVKLASAESLLGFPFDAPDIQTAGTINPDSLTANTASVYGPAAALDDTLPLDTVRARYLSAGIAKIEIISAADVILQQWQVSAAAGINTFAAGADFDAGYVPPAGAHLGIRWVSGSFLRYQNGGAGSYRWTRAGSNNVGDTVVDPAATTVTVAVEVVQKWPALNERVSVAEVAQVQIEARLSALENKAATPPRGVTPIIRTRFPGSSLPAGMAGTGWTVSAGLLVPGPSSTYNTPCHYNTFSAAGRKHISARAKVSTAASAIFGISCFPMESPNYYFGTLALVDAAANRVRLQPWTGASTGPYSAGREAVLPFAVTDGSDVQLDLLKIAGKLTFTVSDPISGASVQISGEQGDGVEVGRAWGKAGVFSIGNDASFSRFDYAFGTAPNPCLIALGDSNTEGPSTLGADYLKGYAHVIDATRGKADVLVAGRGGDESINLLARLALDLDAFTPQYVSVMIGTNEDDHALWRSRYQSIVDRIVSRGAIPILCTLFPKTGSEAKNALFNADILGGFFGAHPVAQTGLAMSNGDGVTWNSAFDSGDHIHANVAGHARAALQFFIDCPFLLD